MAIEVIFGVLSIIFSFGLSLLSPDVQNMLSGLREIRRLNYWPKKPQVIPLPQRKDIGSQVKENAYMKSWQETKMLKEKYEAVLQEMDDLCLQYMTVPMSDLLKGAGIEKLNDFEKIVEYLKINLPPLRVSAEVPYLFIPELPRKVDPRRLMQRGNEELLHQFLAAITSPKAVQPGNFIVKSISGTNFVKPVEIKKISKGALQRIQAQITCVPKYEPPSISAELRLLGIICWPIGIPLMLLAALHKK